MDDDRELAHALMAVLRYWYQARTGKRVTRGDCPHPLRATGGPPVASGALLDGRTGRVVVAAEAIAANMTRTSVEAALGRVAPLMAFVADVEDDGEVPRGRPEIWLCAPAPYRDALAATLALPAVTWVPYAVGSVIPPERAEVPEALRPDSIARLVARRDAIVRDHIAARQDRVELLREAEALLARRGGSR